jgi:GTPase SAR1 family protein
MPKISKFKVVLVGDQNVGKTSVISRLIHDSFDPSLNVNPDQYSANDWNRLCDKDSADWRRNFETSIMGYSWTIKI